MSGSEQQDRGLGALRILRITWMLWLASFLVLYACPVAYLESFELWRTDPQPWRDLHMGTEWALEPELWVPMTLALAAPTLLHRALVRRIGTPFFLRRGDAVAPLDYRSPPPWEVVASPRAVHRLVVAYAGRLGAAMAIVVVPFDVLMRTRFINNYGCVGWPHVRSPPEHLCFATLLLAVAAYHAPTERRVLGPRPNVGDARAGRV